MFTVRLRLNFEKVFFRYIFYLPSFFLARLLNNNPDIFTRDARPIVEFSVENRKAVNARVKRLEKSRENNPNFKDGGGSKASNKQGGAANEFKKKDKKEQIEDKPGFMGTVNNPKQRNLPSHMGPKIRHNRPNTVISRKEIKRAEKNQKRKRPAAAEGISNNSNNNNSQPSAKSAKLNNGSSSSSKANDNSGAAGEEKKTKKNRKKKKFSKSATNDFREEKQFTELVNKYRVKLDPGAGGGLPMRNKWFDG